MTETTGRDWTMYESTRHGWVRVYGTRPDHEAAHALVRRRINAACEYERDGQDWRERFTLHPVICFTTSNTSGRPYGVRRWGVYLTGASGETERPLGHVSTNFYGDRLKFLPYGLLDAEPETPPRPEPSGVRAVVELRAAGISRTCRAGYYPCAGLPPRARRDCPRFAGWEMPLTAADQVKTGFVGLLMCTRHARAYLPRLASENPDTLMSNR